MAEIGDALSADPLLFALCCGILGLLVGSFFNVVIHRLPKMMENDWLAQCAELRGEEASVSEPLSLIRPRSRCPSCKRPVGALENIPVLSWLLLRGKCAGCKSPISPRYPIVEALTGLLSGLVAMRFGFGWASAGALLLIWALIALTFIDADSQLLMPSRTFRAHRLLQV